MSEGGKGEGTLKSNDLGEYLDAVAASLGISRDRWFKLKTIFTKAQQGDAEAQELMRALDAGDISGVTLHLWGVESSTIRNDSLHKVVDSSKMRGQRVLKFEQSGAGGGVFGKRIPSLYAP